MTSEVMLYVAVAVCPTVCQHCWAQGVPYPAQQRAWQRVTSVANAI
jgi:hypothetical protein